MTTQTETEIAMCANSTKTAQCPRLAIQNHCFCESCRLLYGGYQFARKILTLTKRKPL